MAKQDYLFVDGGYLRGVLEKFSVSYFNNMLIMPNVQALSHGFRKTFYYDCLPQKNESEGEKDYERRISMQEAFFKKARGQAGVHVIEGVVKGTNKRRQKGIDVAIAVDMLTHSHHRNMEEATLMAGDLDFKPVIEALVRDGMYVTLWYEQSSASEDLVLAADAQRIMTIQNVFDILPEELLEKYPRPREGSRQHENRKSPLKRGTSSFGTEIFLYKVGDRYEIVSRSPGSEHEGYIIHPDREFLDKYAIGRYGSKWA